jgi:site-specific DNA recombinase
MAKAIGYSRVSTKEQAENGNSLEHQKKKIRQWCQLRDLELEGVIEDAGFSAKSKRRPGLTELKKMVRNQEIDAVVCVDMDRLFRNTLDCLKFKDLCEKKDIGPHFIRQLIDTTTPEGEFMFTILAATARFESRKNGQRVAGIIKHRKSKNLIYGQVPYGWRREGNDLVPDKEELKVIRQMHALKRNGLSYNLLAQELDKAGIPTKNGCKKWHRQKVHDIIERTKEVVNQ